MAVPSPDLTRLLPFESLATPTMLAAFAAPPIQPVASAETSAEVGSTAGYTCYNSSVYGRVVSSEAVQMPGYVCRQSIDQQDFTSPLNYGPCPYASTYYPSPNRCSFDLTMNVRLADPSDAAKMPPGKTVRLAGEFQVTRQSGKDYLSVANARVTWADPFA